MAKRNNKEKPAHLIARAKAKFTTYPVKEPCELLEFLMKAKEGISRTTAKSLLANRQVFVDHVITTQYNRALTPGMKVQISKGKGKKELHSKFLKVLYEDAYLIVVDKREGILTIGTEKQKERTAHTILNEYVKHSGRQHRVYVVHRLDKEASGLLVFAKDEKTKFTLQDHWEDIVKERKYVALLSGEMKNDKGVITSWIRDNKMYFAYTGMSNNDGEKATTYYNTIKRANGYSLVELQPGKKNQVRVHMQQLKHPILGDDRYGDGNNPLDRLALHAFKFSFYHPVTNELMEFETPYPGTFKKMVLKGQPSKEHTQSADE